MGSKVSSTPAYYPIGIFGRLGSDLLQVCIMQILDLGKKGKNE
jgi:hypothetical protein